MGSGGFRLPSRSSPKDTLLIVSLLHCIVCPRVKCAFAFFWGGGCGDRSNKFSAKWVGPPSGFRSESPRPRRRSQMMRAEQEQRGQLQRALHHQLGRTGAGVGLGLGP